MAMIPADIVQIDSDTQVKTGPGILVALTLATPAGTATLEVYDGTSAAGRPMITLTMATNDTASFVPFTGVAFSVGLFVDITGVSAIASVSYI